jgi:hypothetical protein
LKDRIEPWIQFLNYYINQYGYVFLTNPDLQRLALDGKTLTEYLQSVYLNQPEDAFRMYGRGGYTFQHLSVDQGAPDFIYVRPAWYLTYVKNLATLLAYKYNLKLLGLNMDIFTGMVEFAKENSCSLKGIIDFEIARLKGERVFYIPVFYASDRIIAGGDAVLNTNYLQIAQGAKDMTLRYMKDRGISDPDVGEIRGPWKFNADGVFDLLAFKISY